MKQNIQKLCPFVAFFQPFSYMDFSLRRDGKSQSSCDLLTWGSITTFNLFISEVSMPPLRKTSRKFETKPLIIVRCTFTFRYGVTENFRGSIKCNGIHK